MSEFYEQPDEQKQLFIGSQVRIAEDAMTAWLCLKAPASQEEYTREEIIGFLESQGIVQGFHQSNIAAMAKKHIYDREVKVAAGLQPVDGADGYYEYFFTPIDHKTPAVLPDGSVDYSSMSMLQNVKKGEKVALYHEPIQGSEGYTVRGTVLRPKPAKAASPLRGRNIERLEDGITYVSQKDGKIELVDERVDVQETHEIHEDVTLITKRVEFLGDVTIYGNVESGVTIRAGRNIVVTGTVESAEFYAGGDIILERGITGGMRAKITARGSVFADFIENAWVKAGENVQANTILNSTVSADGKVILTGSKGFLLGGYTHGLLGVDLVNVGNDKEIKTIVHAGYEEKTYDAYLATFQKEKEVQQKLDRITQDIKEFQRFKRVTVPKPGSADEVRLRELFGQQEACSTELEKISQERDAIFQDVQKGKGAVIKVKGNVYRGVIICLETSQYAIENNTCFMKYEVSGGAVMGSVIII